MSPTLPPRPHLDWLKNRAKERLAELRSIDPQAKLAQAQRDVARTYGFSSWRRLKAAVDAAGSHSAQQQQLAEEVVAVFLRAAALDEREGVKAMLAAAPGLVHAVGPHPFWGGRPQALHVVIEADRRQVFDRLLAAGADIDGRNEAYAHWSPLLLAIQRDRVAMRDELIRRGARIGLAEALLLGDDQRIERLLADGESALAAPVPSGGSWLAFARTVLAVDRLLDLGASVDQPDAFGSTPLQALSALGEPGRALLERLEERGARLSAPDLARLGDRPGLERLIAGDPGIAGDPSVLVAAVGAGHHDLVAWLLERGADPCARCSDGDRQTVLHVAAWNGDLEMARLLVDAGARVDDVDEHHRTTPAGWAETAAEVANRPRCLEVAAFLARL